MKKDTEKDVPENADDKEQSQRFVEIAESLRVDKSGKSFKKAIKKISESDRDS